MEDKSDVKLLSSWASPFCMRVILALEYKGIKYEIMEGDKLNQNEFLQQCNPAVNKAPVLIHNGKAIPESLIILEYIDETWPSHNGLDLLPKDPYARALARFWGDFIDKKILSIVGGIVKTKGKDQEKAKVELVEEFIRLDNTLATISLGQAFFSGDHMGFIDIVVAPYMPWLRAVEQMVNLKLPDSSKCPHMNHWMDKMYDHPCVRKALEQPDKLLDYAKSLRKRNFGSV
ncbi:hypothetical protein SUGI_0756900 [Cryptomeria japonica]|uniref:glutathione S-transferase U17 n=1 Tax=Cryptomeria japonica TaxID=3369 RepID=UPI002414BB5F|nr:glutathione S-transferase U17 [Cryptomeria japonica]GLJ37309.1 hypothetical protein SUGI_0756900 [Cryptomeria japonica]